MSCVRWFLVFLVAGSVVASASASVVRFRDVGLADFVTAFFGDYLGVSFSVAPDVLAGHAKSEFELDLPALRRVLRRGRGRSVKGRLGRRRRLALALVRHYLAAQGIHVDVFHGMYFVGGASQGQVSLVAHVISVYKLRARGTQYLLGFLRPLFPDVLFSGRNSSVRAQVAAPVASVSAVGQARPIDNGTSAYSLGSKAGADVLVFSGSVADVAAVRSVLRQIDVSRRQCVVRAYLYEVSTGTKVGHALSIAAGVLSGRLGGSLSVGSVTGDQVSVSVGGVDLVASALDADSHFHQISRPQLVVQDGGSALFQVGSDVPVLGSVSTFGNGVQSQSVSYRPSGVVLSVSAVIRRGLVELHVSQQVSNFEATTTGVSGSPTLLKRALSTVVSLRPGQVVLVGGLDGSSSAGGVSGPSFLPGFLRSRTASDDSDSVLLVLSADIVP